MTETYRENHIVLQKIYEAAKANVWFKADIRNWSVRVKNDHRNDNILGVVGGEVAVLQETIRVMHTQFMEQCLKVTSLERVAREAIRQSESSNTELKDSIKEIKDLLMLHLGSNKKNEVIENSAPSLTL